MIKVYFVFCFWWFEVPLQCQILYNFRHRFRRCHYQPHSRILCQPLHIEPRSYRQWPEFNNNMSCLFWWCEWLWLWIGSICWRWNVNGMQGSTKCSAVWNLHLQFSFALFSDSCIPLIDHFPQLSTYDLFWTLLSELMVAYESYKVHTMTLAIHHHCVFCHFFLQVHLVVSKSNWCWIWCTFFAFLTNVRF